MIDNLELLNDADVQSLARKIKDLEKVEQVRWWKPLPSKMRDKFEENGRLGPAMTFGILVKGLEYNYEPGKISSSMHSDQYIPLMTMVSENDYKTESNHENVVIKIKAKIDDYYATGNVAFF